MEWISLHCRLHAEMEPPKGGIVASVLRCLNIASLRKVCSDHGLSGKGNAAQLRIKIVEAMTRELGGVVRSDSGVLEVVDGDAALALEEVKVLEVGADPQATAALALKIAGDERLSKVAMQSLRGKIHAFRTVRSRDSRLKLALEILAKMSIEPFPLSRVAMEWVMAVLVAAKYRSAQLYVSAMRVENTLRGHVLDQAAADYYVHLRRASVRGIGPAKQSEALTEEILLKLEVASRNSFWKRLRFLGYIIAWHLLLRGDELCVLHCGIERVEVVDGGLSAKVHITGDKTNIVGRDKVRVLGCCCAQVYLPCPAHACAALVDHGRRRAGAKPLSSEPLVVRECGSAYSTQLMLYWLRLDLESVGVQLLGSRGQQLWGMHTFRRGGAQAMARARWSAPTIQAWARWESNIIAQYIAEAPLGISELFAASIVGGTDVQLSACPVVTPHIDGPARLAVQRVQGSSMSAFKRCKPDAQDEDGSCKRERHGGGVPGSSSSSPGGVAVVVADGLVSGHDALLDS